MLLAPHQRSVAAAIVACSTFLSAALLEDASAADTPEPPNIVLILADDLGYGDLSCLNPDSKIPTPNMDRLAREGMTFTDAHTPSAVCTPTRYGILSGRYCWPTRLHSGVLLGFDRPLIEPHRPTIASLLRQRGYHTVAVGKWHLGLGWQLRDGRRLPEKDQLAEDPNIDYTRPIQGGPLALGFDEFFGITASLDMAPYCYIEDDRVTMAPSAPSEGRAFPENWRAGMKSADFEHDEVLSTLTRKAVAYVDEHAKAAPSRPLFLYFAPTAPHTPVLPTAPFVGESKAGAYGDFVVQVDWAVGQIVEALER